jgi:hypothetical protein
MIMNQLGNFGMSLRVRKEPKKKKSGHKARRKHRSAVESLLEQPMAELAGAVRCRLCGHPIDAKRLHPHMVRVHGARFSRNDLSE